MKQRYTEAIGKLDLMDKLAAYEPTLIGTPPLAIDIESSDIDVACSAENLTSFVTHVSLVYSNQVDFSSETFQTRGKPAARCSFIYDGWEIELFCQTIPIDEQWGVRHFRVEKQLLELEPVLADRIIQLKRTGMKTEAAFASVLQLPGDPFKAVLELEKRSVTELQDLLSRAISMQPG